MGPKPLRNPEVHISESQATFSEPVGMSSLEHRVNAISQAQEFENQLYFMIISVQKSKKLSVLKFVSIHFTSNTKILLKSTFGID